MKGMIILIYLTLVILRIVYIHSNLVKPGVLDGLTKENILYSHPAVLVHLKLLFNMICTHGFVPDNFGVGVIVPVLKD